MEAISQETPSAEDNTLSMWVIYENPKDLNARYALRRWCIGQGTVSPALEDPKIADTLDQIHAQLPPGRVRLPNNDSDDPCILETWV